MGYIILHFQDISTKCKWNISEYNGTVIVLGTLSCNKLESRINENLLLHKIVTMLKYLESSVPVGRKIEADP